VSFLIDTDICSAHLKQSGPVATKFLQHSGQLHVSVVTVGELLTWALRAQAPPARLQGVEKLFADMTMLDVTEAIVRRFGQLRAAMLDVGRPIGEMDLLIAATALEHGLAIVTHNVRDFANVPGLTIVDWLSP
jgi:tRNA(fMet)-specific endonuclease VapC